MIPEQIGLLLALYRRPIQGAGRIIDEGRVGFALVAALLALAGLQTEFVFMVRHAASSAVHEAHVQHPINPEEEDGDDTGRNEAMALVQIAELLRPLGSPLAAVFAMEIWLGTQDSALFPKALAVLALAFVPAAILVITFHRSHESFPVMLRKDYFSLLNCVLMCVVAAYLPLAILTGVFQLLKYPVLWMIGLFPIAQVYFLILVACCVRTLSRGGFPAAIGAAAAGCAGSLGLLSAFAMFGSLPYFFVSPCLLYYAYTRFGSNVRSLGDGLRSRQHMRRQLDIATNNPRDADAHYQLGLIYQERLQYDEAKERFTRAVEIDSKEADPVFQLGKIALTEGRVDDAIRFLSNAAALDDKCSSHEVWRELGVAYFQASRMPEATKALGKYVQRRPYDPEGLYWRGKTYIGLQRLDEAKESFESCKEAVQTMPPHRRRQVARWQRLASNELRGLEKARTV